MTATSLPCLLNTNSRLDELEFILAANAEGTLVRGRFAAESLALQTNELSLCVAPKAFRKLAVK